MSQQDRLQGDNSQGGMCARIGAQFSGDGVGGISGVAFLKAWVEKWQVGEGWRGAGLISSSKGVVGEVSQSEDDVVEMEVVGPPHLEISNGLATPFFGRRETQESPEAHFPPSPRCWDPSVGVCTLYPQ